MKIKKKIIFPMLFLVSLVTGGCGKRAPSPGQTRPQTVFTTNVPDQRVELYDHYQALRPVIPRANAQGDIEIQGKDWMTLSEELLDAGQSLGSEGEGDPLLSMGHRLDQAFYSRQDNSTQMFGTSQPAGNPYTEQGLDVAKPMLVGRITGAVENAEPKVKEAAKQTVMQTLPPMDKPEPEKVIQILVAGLKDFKAKLSSKKNQQADPDGSKTIDEIIAGLDQGPLLGLQEFQIRATPHTGESSAAYLGRLGEGLKKLNQYKIITDEDLAKMKNSLELPTAVAQSISEVDSADKGLKLLIDLWLNKLERKRFPAELAGALRNFRNKDLLAFATDNGPLVSAAEFEVLQARKNNLRGATDLQLTALASKNLPQFPAAADWSALLSKKSEISTLLTKPEAVAFMDSLSNGRTLNEKDKFVLVVSHWLGLSMRMASPPELQDGFGQFSDSDLEAIRNNSVSGILKIKPVFARSRILKVINTWGSAQVPADGIRNFKALMDTTVISSVQWGLVDALSPFISTLPKQVEHAIVTQLEGRESSAVATVTDYFMKLSRYYISKWIFGTEDELKKPLLDAASKTDTDPTKNEDNKIIARHPLPILEKSILHFSRKPGEPPRVPSPEQTSAELLGLSLSNAVSRLATMGIYEKLGPSSRESMAVTFRALCQMSILMGYNGYNGKLVEGLTVPMTRGNPGKRLDVRNYQPEKVTFATPDRIYLKNRYKLDGKSENNATASVDGQMELLRGFSKMLRYMKPWVHTTFDVGLGLLRLDEESSFAPFDKEQLFQLGFGLSSIVLRNLPVRSLGFVYGNGDFVEMSKLPKIPGSLLPDFTGVVGVVVTDYDLNGASHKISTAGMAKAMLAITEFYSVSGDLNQTKDGTIKENMPLIDKYRPLIGQMVTGMAMFASSHLMMNDGGFVHGFDLDQKAATNEPRNLEDQVLMSQALLKVGEMLNSDLFRFRAVDNFFFLNAKFWNPKLGFYDLQEGAAQNRTRLSLVARSLDNLVHMRQLLEAALTQSPNLSASLEQMDRLKLLWLHRFFNPEIQNLDPVNQVLEFSL